MHSSEIPRSQWGEFLASFYERHYGRLCSLAIENEAARDFNRVRASFPTVIYAGIFGARFAPKVYFRAQAGAEVAPRVEL